MNEISNSDLCANDLFLCHEENSPEVYLELEEVEPKYDSYDEEEIPLELPVFSKPEPTLQSFLCEDRNKHCKDISAISTLPNLFVLVTADQEKSFGLSNVKEFCVSNSVFAKMIKSFKEFEFEEFSEQKVFMFEELGNSDFVLKYNFFRDTFEHELFPKDQDFVLDKWFSKLEQFISFSRKDSCHLVSIKASLDIIYLLIFDYFDMICLPWPKVSYAGFGLALKRKRGTLKREEDKRFRPPDLDQDEHTDATHSMLIKHEPPDAITKPTPSLNKFEGNSCDLCTSVFINLFVGYTDHADSRSNPFEEGGDDVILLTPGCTYIRINQPQDARPDQFPDARFKQPTDAQTGVRMDAHTSARMDDPDDQTLDQTRTNKLADVLGGFIRTFLIIFQPP